MHHHNTVPVRAFTPMPQLTTVDVRGLNGYRKWGDESEMEDAVNEEQKECWKKYVKQWSRYVLVELIVCSSLCNNLYG